MRVQKRNGEYEDVSFDKVLQRIRKASRGRTVNPDILAQQVLARIIDGIKTSELDILAAQMAASLSTTHPDWGYLASQIAVSNHQKNTPVLFSEVVRILSNQIAPKTGKSLTYVSQEIVDIMSGPLGQQIDAYIKHNRDYDFDYFGFKTLEKSYLLRDSNKVVIERPQHMWMRVSLALWGTNLERVFETYDLMSQKVLTHATPTLFNAGTPRQQLSSCFLLAMKEDSIAGIYDTLKDCALISKHAGGIGLSIHDIRARGALIEGTNGTSNGLVPMLRNFNATARYVDQCFTPDTIIYTESGPKPIEDVSISDKVLTSGGTYESVRLPVRHEYSGTILEIQVKNAVYPVRVTPEHQVYALQGQTKGLNFDVIRNRLDKDISKPEFVDAQDLVPGDFVVFPIPTYVKDIAALSEEDCRFYGIMLGDGYISQSVAGVCLNTTTKKDVMDFVLKYLGERGISPNMYHEEGTSTVRVKWSHVTPAFKFTASQLYDANKQKKIDTPFLHLPLEKAKEVLRGIIETDGCIGEKEISLELSSYPLIEGARYLLLRLGALSSGYERNRVGHVSSTRDIHTNLPTAVLRIPRIAEIIAMFPDAPSGEFFSYMRHGDNLYTRIETIDECTYTGIVHDFEIEAPHDYVVAHLGVAHNGGGRRNGSFAVYLEPWHADVEDFLRLKLNSGSEEERARDLFYALWISDLFMRRVEADEKWSLFCPSEAPGLADVYGEEFEALYTSYEAKGLARKVLDARTLWYQILETQMETGTPYLLYKDPANKKSNQKNLGTIRSSNLCTEIIEYSAPNETAVCNLASIALPAFVGPIAVGFPAFDFGALRKAVAVAIRNLNRVIDINFYPTEETRRSNMRHRPVGLGVQGLADVFAMLKLPWDSAAAAELNQRIFEHVYYAATQTSTAIAMEEGPYETFKGSPASKGILQPDMWGVTPLTEKDGTMDWAGLRKGAAMCMRNSLLVAPMPTASTSQILGYTECFEPFTSNMYTRRVLAGEFTVINKYLVKELLALGLWTDGMKQAIVMRKGSVQGIPAIPEEIQLRYKTAWEIPQKTLIDMAAARGAFICQSQSLNLFMADPTISKLTSMHFYAWKSGLKTGCYYLRTKAPVAAQQFTVDPRLLAALDHQSTITTVAQLPEEAYNTDSDDEPPPPPPETREQKLKRLSKQYEDALQNEEGEGCLSCSS
jgi:ribonucleoside-diphosphate reductase alpha chain